MPTPLNEFKLKVSGYLDQLRNDHAATISNDQKTRLYGGIQATRQIQKFVDETFPLDYDTNNQSGQE